MSFLHTMFITLLKLSTISALTKVIVPAVYKEWTMTSAPIWMTSASLQEKYNYSTFLYQKTNATAPNYIKLNRGTEAGVYLRYIVDHYDNFPDVAVFVHAHPTEHQPHFLEMVGCIHPNASFINFNDGYLCRDTRYWKYSEGWVEQCWRDILAISWDLANNIAELNTRIPLNRPVKVCFVPSQQFLISRAEVHRRELQTWKQLLRIIGEQEVCHEGAVDSANLHFFARTNVSIGPETPNLWSEDETVAQPGYGAHTQGGGMEHLAHVVYGHQDLQQRAPSNEDYCRNFLRECPFSPCK